jgi:hypothetical protein
MANRNRAFRILLTSTAATSVMTTFSYFVSKVKKDNYKEPLLLADFFEKAVIKEKRQSTLLSAWTAHYAIGFLFGLIYEPTFAQTNTGFTVKKGLCFGLSAGTTAILAWSALFKIHPDRPKINFNVFYRQLMASHLIFGVIYVGVRSAKKIKRQ